MEGPGFNILGAQDGWEGMEGIEGPVFNILH